LLVSRQKSVSIIIFLLHDVVEPRTDSAYFPRLLPLNCVGIPGALTKPTSNSNLSLGVKVMRRKALTFFLALTIISVQSPVALAQEASVPSREWATVVALAPDGKLEVKLKSGKTVKGRLSSVTDAGLTLSNGKRIINANRQDISRVYRAGGKSGVSPTVIGAGVGAGVGLAAGGVILAVNEGEDDETVPGLILTAMVGAGIGALTGFLSGKARNNRVLIYESQ
jgi:hypothetical protein